MVAAYLIGSGALDGFVPEQSDVDMVAICAEAPSDECTRAIVDVLAREAMTWPVRGLEFVLYARAAAATPSRTPQFEINLNVGQRMPLHLSLDPALEPVHWLMVDLAIVREHDVALAGPRGAQKNKRTGPPPPPFCIWFPAGWGPPPKRGLRCFLLRAPPPPGG